jgi:hypothetical protein
MSLERPIRVYRSAIDQKYRHVYGDPERMNRFDAAAGVVTVDDISSIEAIVILDEVLGRARPRYKLRPICRPVPMDQLVGTFDIATGITGQEKVPPMVEADISKEAWGTVSFSLWKNVVHVAVSDEAGMRARHPLLDDHISQAALDLARMENKQISEALDANTNTTGATGVWDTFTTGVSDNNPWDDIRPRLEELEGYGYEPTLSIMHPNVWGDFISNTYVRNLVDAGIMSVTRDGGSFTLPGYPLVRVLTDYAVLPVTSFYIIAEEAPALVLGTGPTMAARYRKETAGYGAYQIRQWLQPQIIDHYTTESKYAITEITGASS